MASKESEVLKIISDFHALIDAKPNRQDRSAVLVWLEKIDSLRKRFDNVSPVAIEHQEEWTVLWIWKARGDLMLHDLDHVSYAGMSFFRIQV